MPHRAKQSSKAELIVGTILTILTILVLRVSRLLRAVVSTLDIKPGPCCLEVALFGVSIFAVKMGDKTDSMVRILVINPNSSHAMSVGISDAIAKMNPVERVSLGFEIHLRILAMLTFLMTVHRSRRNDRRRNLPGLY